MSHQPAWKIVIAEDEPIIMRGIETILTMNESLACEVVGRAYNGLEAVELILQCSPDIVITDIKMPGMDGIELLHYIFKEHKNISTVVLSGFNDYEYLRKAINYRTVDYVLKPVQPEEIIESVHRAIERRLAVKKEQSEKEQLQFYANLWVRHVQDQQLDKWIQGEGTIQETELIHLMEPAESMYFTLGLLHFDGSIHYERSEAIEWIRCAAMEFDGVACFPTRHGEQALIFFHSTDSVEFAATAARRIKELTEAELKIPVFLVLSSTYSDLEHLTTAYHQCKDISLLSNLYTNDILIADQVRFPSAHAKVNLQTEIEAVVSAIRKESQEDALTCVKHLLACAVQDQPNPQLLAHRLNVAYLEMWYRFKEYCKEDELSALVLRISKPAANTDWNLLVSDASQFVQSLIKAVHSYGSYKKQIHKAKQYIEGNFDRNLTLKEVADHVYLSPAYFSALFKTETGKNYVDYLNSVRIAKSKQLLQQTDEKIYSIAEKVGYRSMQHFGKIFKDLVGLTPSEYREINFEK